MSDIVERLRERPCRYASETEDQAKERRQNERCEAAAEIERLRAALDSTDAAKTLWENKAKQHLSRIEHLEAALRPFADALKGNWSMQPGSMKIIAGPWASDLRIELTLAHFRNASYALDGAAPSAPEKEGE